MNTEPKQESIVDIISEGRFEAMQALSALFGGQTELSALQEYTPVIVALQALPKELLNEVGMGIIDKFFEDNDLDPKKAEDRRTAAPYAELLAQNIGSAANAIYQQLQMQARAQAESQARLSQGLLGANG